mgnify:CR=1 FL=1
MGFISDIVNHLNEFNTASVLFRLTLAVICGGLIGIERGRKHRPAGFRTYMLVCLGAALTMIISQYVTYTLNQSTDITRLGAQVINGIGFLGAGTIIVTRRQQVKGLTTAAGLWASACMGIAIGAGFYVGALTVCVLIIIVLIVLSKLEVKIMTAARNMTLSVGYTQSDDIVVIIDKIKSLGVRIIDVEIVKLNTDGNFSLSAVFYVSLPKKYKHTDLIEQLAGINGVNLVEEL